jgi:hypothetical protein
MLTIKVRPTRSNEKFSENDNFIAWWEGQAAGHMDETVQAAVKGLMDTIEPPIEQA